MDIERELEILIEKHKGKQVGLGEIRLDWFAEDCLKEIRRLKSAIAALQAYQPAAIFKTETTSCEWCNGKEYIIDACDYTCLEITGNKLTAWGEGEATYHINYCPNCGRKLDWEED